MWRWTLPALLIVPLALGASGRRKAAGDPFRVYYTANRQGEIDPCGCAVHQIGGLGRMKALLDREANPSRSHFFVDAGDTFFASESLNPMRRNQDVLRARVIADSYRNFRVDAITPGPRDFAAGVDVLRDLKSVAGVEFVAANLSAADGKPLVDAYRIIERGGIRVGITGAVDPEEMARVVGVKVTPALPALKEAVGSLRKAGVDSILVLSQLGTVRDREVAAWEDVSLIVGGHTLEALTQPVVVGRAWLVQPLPLGEQLGIVDLIAASDAPWSHRLVDLGQEFDGENTVVALIASHKAAVRSLAIADTSATQASPAEKPFVANPRSCRGCHTKQYDFWATTHHASAYLVLFAKNQHFDPECIECHSLGFEKGGGFSKIALPLEVDSIEKKGTKKGSPPFIEALMGKVFAKDSKKPLDSRLDPKRYGALKQKYHAQIDELEGRGTLKRLFIGVQCEHCHGNRDGHPSASVPTVKKVSETTCRECHKPPHDTAFDFAKNVKKVGCPLSSGS